MEISLSGLKLGIQIVQKREDEVVEVVGAKYRHTGRIKVTVSMVCAPS